MTAPFVQLPQSGQTECNLLLLFFVFFFRFAERRLLFSQQFF
jgi:hypothetical protein